MSAKTHKETNEKSCDYTNENRDSLITEQKALGFTLIEDQRHFDGNHLVFENDEPESPPRDPLVEIAKLEERIEALEEK